MAESQQPYPYTEIVNLKQKHIKKNIATVFGDSESFLHAKKKIFQSKKIKYLVVTNSNNLVRGIIENLIDKYNTNLFLPSI